SGKGVPKMKRALAAAGALAFCAGNLGAQEVIRRTETTEIRTETAPYTEVRTEVTTIIREYVTYLRRVYTEVGLSEEVIVRVIRIDVEIFEAWVRLDFERVRI